MQKHLYQFTRLLDGVGAELPKPASAGVVELSFNAGEGKAQVFSGRDCLAELEDARIVWIEAGGIRLHGVERISANQVQYQRWHLTPRQE